VELWLHFILWHTSGHMKISMTNGMIIGSLSLAQELGTCKETDPSFLKFETVGAVLQFMYQFLLICEKLSK